MCDRDDHIPISAIQKWPPGAAPIRVTTTEDQWGRTHRAVVLQWTEKGHYFSETRIADFSIEEDTPGEYLGERFDCNACLNRGFIKGIGDRDVPCQACS